MPHSVFELRFGLEVSILMPFEEISMGLSVPIVFECGHGTGTGPYFNQAAEGRLSFFPAKDFLKPIFLVVKGFLEFGWGTFPIFLLGDQVGERESIIHSLLGLSRRRFFDAT